jgi:hypothetical protein
LHGKRLRYGDFRGEPSVRLFRKQSAQFELRDGRVEVGIPSGKVGSIKSRIVYEACPSMERCVQDMMRFATRAAEDARRKGRHASYRTLVWRVPLSFFRSYILRWGWLDGWAGLNAGFLAAFAVYLREAIHCEIDRPAFEQRPLVHDSWRQFKAHVPDEAADQQRVRSAA